GIRDYHVTGVQTGALPILAEKLVQKIEGEVLIPAEKAARTYVMNRLDRVRPSDLDSYPGLSGYTHLYDVQEFFNNYYTEIWTYEIGRASRREAVDRMGQSG